MIDQGEFLGQGYVRGTGQVYIFQDLSDTKRLVVRPVRYDGDATSISRDRVSWRKTKSASSTDTQG